MAHQKVWRTVWEHKQYAVLVAALVVIVIGASNLAQHNDAMGWYGVIGGCVLLLGALAAVLRERKVRAAGQRPDSRTPQSHDPAGS